MTTVIKISEDCIWFINNEGPRTLQNLCVFVCLGYVSCPTCKFFTHENFSTYCDTGHLCIWSYPMSRFTCKCFWAFGSWIVNTCFNGLGMSRTRFEHPIFHMWGKHSNRLYHCCSQNLCERCYNSIISHNDWVLM